MLFYHQLLPWHFLPIDLLGDYVSDAQSKQSFIKQTYTCGAEATVMMNNPTHQLQMTNPDHLRLAAAQIAHGEIIVMSFNGIFVIVGDADNPEIPDKIAAAKGRPKVKGVALVCPPEYLAEQIDRDAAPLREHHALAQILRLYQTVHAIGAILPAALPGAPAHVVQAGTILNVWSEYLPHQPIRQLINELRKHGKRALVGSSANKTGQPTLIDAQQAVDTFQNDISLMLLDTFDGMPAQYRRSTSIIDFTGPVARLYREGSLSAQELQAQMTRLGLGSLIVGTDVQRV